MEEKRIPFRERYLAKLAAMSPEEKAQREEDSRIMMEAFSRIKAVHGEFKAGRAGHGIVECPKCKGKLHYNVASLNGHVWGKCETKDCLAWMM